MSKKAAKFKIEKGVEMPKPRSRSRWPFGEMAVGDSFIADGGEQYVRQAAFSHGKKYEKKFSIRTVEGGLRIWRIK